MHSQHTQSSVAALNSNSAINKSPETTKHSKVSRSRVSSVPVSKTTSPDRTSKSETSTTRKSRSKSSSKTRSSKSKTSKRRVRLSASEERTAEENWKQMMECLGRVIRWCNQLNEWLQPTQVYYLDKLDYRIKRKDQLQSRDSVPELQLETVEHKWRQSFKYPTIIRDAKLSTTVGLCVAHVSVYNRLKHLHRMLSQFVQHVKTLESFAKNLKRRHRSKLNQWPDKCKHLENLFALLFGCWSLPEFGDELALAQYNGVTDFQLLGAASDSRSITDSAQKLQYRVNCTSGVLSKMGEIVSDHLSISIINSKDLQLLNAAKYMCKIDERLPALFRFPIKPKELSESTMAEADNLIQSLHNKSELLKNDI